MYPRWPGVGTTPFFTIFMLPSGSPAYTSGRKVDRYTPQTFLTYATTSNV